VTQALYVLEYALFRSVMGLFRVLGLKAASDLGGWLARTVGPRIPVTRRARRNMMYALPDLSESERNAYIVAMWENLGRTFAEYAHLDKFWALKPGARIEIVDIEYAEAAIAKGKGGLFVSGHCGNWEVMPRCIGDRGLKGTLVYRPPNNP
jgi:KDO2-lipid IV(A) lauroyltransferase